MKYVWILLLIASPFILLWGTYAVIRARLNYLLGGALSGRSLRELIAMLREQEQSTPRTLSAMTRVYLPNIEHDFPEFSYPEFKQKAENMLRSVFTAVEAQDVSLLAGGGTDVGVDFRAQIKLKIAEDKSAGLSRHYADVEIHRTEITAYEKRAGVCVVTLQSAVGLREWAERDGAVTEGDMNKLSQRRYDMQLTYIQNERVTSGGMTGAGLHCPNCGAPIETLGQKVCPYCHMAVSELSIRVWSFTRLSES